MGGDFSKFVPPQSPPPGGGGGGTKISGGGQKFLGGGQLAGREIFGGRPFWGQKSVKPIALRNDQDEESNFMTHFFAKITLIFVLLWSNVCIL